MNKIIEFIRLFNIDILINIITLFISFYAIWKQKAKVVVDTLNGHYFIDYSRGTDEYGNDYIELLPFIRIINKSQLPISIYSIEIILKNKKKLFKRRESYRNIKEIEFYDFKNDGRIIYEKILDFKEPINLEAFQLIEGHLDYWVNGNIKDLEGAKILIKTSRKNYIKKIKFNEINSEFKRKEISVK